MEENSASGSGAANDSSPVEGFFALLVPPHLGCTPNYLLLRASSSAGHAGVSRRERIISRPAPRPPNGSDYSPPTGQLPHRHGSPVRARGQGAHRPPIRTQFLTNCPRLRIKRALDRDGQA